MQYLSVKNLGHYQHYKDRTPPWVKLHRDFLSDYALRQMPITSRWLFSCLWILASETANRIPLDTKYLSERCGASVKIEHLTPLLDSKLLLASGASTLLAHDATDSTLLSSVPSDSEKKKRANGKASGFPKDWQHEEWMKQLCDGFGLNSHFLFAEFRNHHLAKGSVMKSWPHAFRTWVDRAVTYKQKGSRP